MLFFKINVYIWVNLEYNVHIVRKNVGLLRGYYEYKKRDK